jgi:hypothetical protein
VFVVLLIPGLILAGAVAGLELGIHSAFSGTSDAAHLAGVMLQGFFGAVAFAFMLLASICVGGVVSTAVREYALLFYGGRFQKLGELLSSLTAAGPA